MKKEFFEEREYWMKYNQNLPLYHGVRKKNPERIRKEGICSFRTMVDTRIEIRKALRYFGKQRFLYTVGGRGEIIRGLISEMKDPQRRVIYLTSMGKEAACSWAQRNPEFVYLTLVHAGINGEEVGSEKWDIFRYLAKKYGAPYVIKLKETYPVPDANISSHQRCLSPEEIESVERCL